MPGNLSESYNHVSTFLEAYNSNFERKTEWNLALESPKTTADTLESDSPQNAIQTRKRRSTKKTLRSNMIPNFLRLVKKHVKKLKFSNPFVLKYMQSICNTFVNNSMLSLIFNDLKIDDPEIIKIKYLLRKAVRSFFLEENIVPLISSSRNNEEMKIKIFESADLLKEMTEIPDFEV